jgi:hypothetical protein
VLSKILLVLVLVVISTRAAAPGEKTQPEAVGRVQGDFLSGRELEDGRRVVAKVEHA